MGTKESLEGKSTTHELGEQDRPKIDPFRIVIEFQGSAVPKDYRSETPHSRRNPVVLFRAIVPLIGNLRRWRKSYGNNNKK